MKNNKALIFLALVFVALFSYWTFEQVKYYREKDQNKAFENLPDTSSTATQNPETTPSATPAPATGKQGQNVAGSSTSNESVFGKWVANDYKKGDIQKGNYTVKSGDTLWEIAEAVYGDGTQWVNILHANSSSIGYLPNGSQALIIPGQVLLIP